jgi:hypothetical protein
MHISHIEARLDCEVSAPTHIGIEKQVPVMQLLEATG